MANKYGLFRTIPAWDIKDEGYFKNKMLEIFEKLAHDFMEYNFHIREIEAMDLGLEDWQSPPDKQILWSGTPWVNFNLTSHDAVMIFGVSCISEVLSVRKLIFKKGAGGMMVIGRNDLTSLKAYETALKAIKECQDQEWLKETFGTLEKVRMEGYFQEAYIFRPQDCVNIGVVYYPNSPPMELKLMGYVAEAVGKSIA